MNPIEGILNQPLLQEIAGQTVTRTRICDISRTFPEAKQKSFLVKEVTTPVFGKGETVIRGMVYDEPLNKEYDKDKPTVSIVIIGGGSSEAFGNASLIGRVEEAIGNLPIKFPVINHNAIVLPHVWGSPRTKGAITNFHEAAEVLDKALKDPELKCKDRVVLVGFSAGGKQAIELASILGPRCELLMLADSAGLAGHPDLKKEFTMGSIDATFRKYRKQDSNLFQAITHTVSEIGQAWVLPTGPIASPLVEPGLLPANYSAPEKVLAAVKRTFGTTETLTKLALDALRLHSPQKILTENIGKSYGLEDEMAGIDANLSEIQKQVSPETGAAITILDPIN